MSEDEEEEEEEKKKAESEGRDSDNEEGEREKEKSVDGEEEVNEVEEEATAEPRSPPEISRVEEMPAIVPAPEGREEDDDDSSSSLGSLLSSFSAVFLQPFRSLTSVQEVDSRRSRSSSTGK